MTNLSGRTALITGSTSGIGLACARAYARAGADIVLNGLGDSRETTREEVVRDVLLAAQPTRKFVTVDQVAAMAVFLASAAAENINGSLQAMDGGWTAQ